EPGRAHAPSQPERTGPRGVGAAARTTDGPGKGGPATVAGRPYAGRDRPQTRPERPTRAATDPVDQRSAVGAVSEELAGADRLDSRGNRMPLPSLVGSQAVARPGVQTPQLVESILRRWREGEPADVRAVLEEYPELREYKRG